MPRGFNLLTEATITGIKNFAQRHPYRQKAEDMLLRHLADNFDIMEVIDECLASDQLLRVKLIDGNKSVSDVGAFWELTDVEIRVEQVE